MARCRVDSTLQRVEMNGFAFPLGVYPVEPIQPREGYMCWFEPADGNDGGGGGGGEDDWEEWPDRYVFDIAITATRLEALVRALFSMLPGRVYPILDVLGRDAYREVDPYVAYELIGQERIVDAMRRFRAYFFEDGLVGFGAMSEEPFIYVFVDEHKLVTVRVEAGLKERVEGLMAAFDLEAVEEIAGADSVTHEHRTVLEAPEDRRDLLNADEIVEELRDDWGLVLNIDTEKNQDEEGNDLGITGWRCLVRWDPRPEIEEENPENPPAYRYAEVILTAGNLTEAEVLAQEAVRAMAPEAERDEGEPVALNLDRLSPEDLAAIGAEAKAGPIQPDAERAWASRWLE